MVLKPVADNIFAIHQPPVTNTSLHGYTLRRVEMTNEIPDQSQLMLGRF